MESRRLILAIFLSLFIFIGWNLLSVYIWPPPPATQPTTTTAPSTQPVAATQQYMPPTTQQGFPSTQQGFPSTQQGFPSTQQSNQGNNQQNQQPPAPTQIYTVVGANQARTAVLGSLEHNDEKFPLGVDLNARGASINSVTLNRFRKTVKEDDRYVFQQPFQSAGQVVGDAYAMQSLWVRINGAQIDLHNQTWRLAEATQTKATFTIDIYDGSGKLLTLSKTYTLQDSSAPDKGYELGVTLAADLAAGRNAGNTQVQLAMNGPLAPPHDVDRGVDVSVVGGYFDGGYLAVESTILESLNAEAAVGSVLRDKYQKHPAAWAGFSSNYFNAILRPKLINAELTKMPERYSSFDWVMLNPQARGFDRQVKLAIATQPSTLDARNRSYQTQLEVFLGPKKRDLLQDVYYADLPRGYDDTLGINTSCTWCTLPFLVTALVWLLGLFHWMFADWGLAIIGLVALVRLLLYPITKRSTMSMAAMGKFAPELERLKKKYGDNKEELNKAMMEFYRQHGITPILGCIPMLLQMPIWIALWSALSGTFELRHAPLLYGFTWIKDLSQPDMLWTFAPINLFFFDLKALNILPMLLAVVFYLQQKSMPKPVATTPEQAQQQKMMQYMSLLFPIFLYNGPSGLNLYILTSTAYGIFESRRIRAIIDAKEAAEKEGKLVDEDDDASGAQRKKVDSTTVSTKEPPKKKGWLTRLQEKAEELQERGEPQKKKAKPPGAGDKKKRRKRK